MMNAPNLMGLAFCLVEWMISLVEDLSRLISTYQSPAHAISMFAGSCILHTVVLTCSSLHHYPRSSAYKAALIHLGNLDTKSLMKRKKKSVREKTPPWETPWHSRNFILLALSRLTCARQLNRYDLIHFNFLPLHSSSSLLEGYQ